MHEDPVGAHQVERLGQKREPLPLRLGEQGEARDDGGRLDAQNRGDRLRQGIGVAFDDTGLGVALGEKLAEIGVELDQDQPFLGNAAADERFRDRPGSRA